MPELPDPALVVLIGPSGSGKSHWAAQHYRPSEIVSSDELRAAVGTGRHDLDASRDAFAVLDRIVAARLSRGLTTVVDTLGLDRALRIGWRDGARGGGLPAIAVVFGTDLATCRARNAARDIPVPAPALQAQHRRAATALADVTAEGWDLVRQVDGSAPRPAPAAPPQRPAINPGRLRFFLQVSRFPWGDDPASWLTGVAQAAEQVGFTGLGLMDHLIQIPQVGRAWEPIPEPFTALGMLAGATRTLELGTLVSPVTFRPAGVIAKAVATLDALSGGRAFLGLGAGWWAREHAAFGIGLPPLAQRVEALESGVETIRALWAPGTKAYRGGRVDLPETTCYPRPAHDVPIIVGGRSGRVLRVAARWADACNIPSAEERLPQRIERLRELCRAADRDPDQVAVTVLDVPVIGSDREDTARRVARLAGRTAAATYARTHSAGTVADQLQRYQRLADLGVRDVHLALPDLAEPSDLQRLAPLVGAFG